MADTMQQVVTNEWQKISDSDCTMQSSLIDTSYNVAIGADTPTDNFLTLKMAEPVTFAYKSPVWVRLFPRYGINSVNIVVVK